MHGVGVAAVVATGKSSSGGEKRDHSQFRLDEEQFEVSETKEGGTVEIGQQTYSILC